MSSTTLVMAQSLRSSQESLFELDPHHPHLEARPQARRLPHLTLIVGIITLPKARVVGAVRCNLLVRSVLGMAALHTQTSALLVVLQVVDRLADGFAKRMLCAGLSRPMGRD